MQLAHTVTSFQKPHVGYTQEHRAERLMRGPCLRDQACCAASHQASSPFTAARPYLEHAMGLAWAKLAQFWMLVELRIAGVKRILSLSRSYLELGSGGFGALGPDERLIAALAKHAGGWRPGDKHATQHDEPRRLGRVAAFKGREAAPGSADNRHESKAFGRKINFTVHALLHSTVCSTMCNSAMALSGTGGGALPKPRELLERRSQKSARTQEPGTSSGKAGSSRLRQAPLG